MSRHIITSLLSLYLFLCLFSLASCTSKEPKPGLNLANWGKYLSPEHQKKFTESTGIALHITTFSSNEELLAKIQTGGSNIDVAVPSDYMVQVMTKLNLLEKLDPLQIPNVQNLDPKVMKQDFDPQNEYSIPYAWTTVGIAVRKDLYKKNIDSWKDLFENPELKGQIAVLDDMRELAAVALKTQKASVNSTNPMEIQKAFEYLKKIKPQVKIFTSNAVDILKNKEIKAGHVYSSDALMAQKQDPQIDFIIPTEGSTRAIDNMVIIKGAPNKKSAHAFVNFMLTAGVNQQIVENLRAGPVVRGVKEMLPKELQNNKALFPTDEVLSKLERIQDLGEKNSLYENPWTELKIQ